MGQIAPAYLSVKATYPLWLQCSINLSRVHPKKMLTPRRKGAKSYKNLRFLCDLAVPLSESRS
jgi:hypothetical protein